MKEFDRTGSIDLLAFYRRRFFRLVPAIVTALIVAALIERHVGKGWIDSRRAPASLLFYKLQSEPVPVPGTARPALELVSVEEHSYLLFPALLLWLVSTVRPAVRVLLGLCLAAPATRVAYV